MVYFNVTDIINASLPVTFLCRCPEMPSLGVVFIPLFFIAAGAILLEKKYPSHSKSIHETALWILFSFGLFGMAVFLPALFPLF